VPPPDRQPIPPVDASSEVYLHLQSRRAGKIKGEAKALEHVDDIEVTAWQWGAQASSALGSASSTGRPACSYRALTVYKRLDAATTALLWALARNDEIREARLTMRRPGLAGGAREDVFTITLNDARVTVLQHGAAVDGSTCEIVTIESKLVQAQYRTGKPRMPAATLPAAPARRAGRRHRRPPSRPRPPRRPSARRAARSSAMPTSTVPLAVPRRGPPARSTSSSRRNWGATSRPCLRKVLPSEH
jgi:type VI secretion system secreted protein Hcp